MHSKGARCVKYRTGGRRDGRYRRKGHRLCCALWLTVLQTSVDTIHSQISRRTQTAVTFYRYQLALGIRVKYSLAKAIQPSETVKHVAIRKLKPRRLGKQKMQPRWCIFLTWGCSLIRAQKGMLRYIKRESWKQGVDNWSYKA